MHRTSQWVALLHLLLGLGLAVGLGCTDEPVCDGADLRARLAAASPGETVTIGACALTGPFEVPPGVTLEGAGAATIITAPVDGRALDLAPSPDVLMPTTVRGLSLSSPAGCAALVAMGAGVVDVSEVAVRADTGVGIAVEGVSTLRLSEVTLRGPVTAASADTTMAPLPPFFCGSGAIATHGVVLVDVGDARLEAAEASGFGRFGFLAIRSDTTFDGFAARDNLGVGIEIWDGGAEMLSVTVEGTRAGAGAIEVFGVVFGSGAEADTVGLAVSGGAGHGVFHDDANVVHDALVSTDNAFAGAWAQNSRGVSIVGASRLERNAFAGLALFDSVASMVDGATISDTAPGVALAGLSTVRGADGVHASGSDVALSEVALRNNERVGAVFDLAGASTAAVTLRDITVEGTGEALGAVAQNGTVVDGWDDGVTRLGVTLSNDQRFLDALDALDIAEGVGPPCLPPVARVEAGGIADLVGP